MAIYNNGYPATYAPYYQYPYQQGTNQTSGIIWVQGEAGAKSYLVAPNTTVQLWDSERQRIYLKSADASGMPTMKVLDYTIQESTQNAPTVASAPSDASAQYLTRADLEPLYGQINGLKSKIEKMSRKKADDDD